MSKRNKGQRREHRKRIELKRERQDCARSAKIMRLADDVPGLEDFIDGVDTSRLTRLIGIFVCSTDEYLATEDVLERHGHGGYRMLKCEIEGDVESGGDGRARGWAAAVKLEAEPDSEFKIFVGIVKRQPTAGSGRDLTNRMSEIVAIAHELGHAFDMQFGDTFRFDRPIDIEEAEYVAHTHACRLLRDNSLVMGLVAYLSIAICAVIDSEGESVARAAQRFVESDEYRQCIMQIPSFIRRHFDLKEPQ